MLYYILRPVAVFILIGNVIFTLTATLIVVLRCIAKSGILSLCLALAIPTLGFSKNVPEKPTRTHLKGIPAVVSKAKLPRGNHTASWYAKYGDDTDPWIHARTANGEAFDENAQTAASWIYPLGSIVRVTNKMNGKTVIVRINDRGPSKRLLKKGRTIDLSKGAFSKIADLKLGIIPIKTELIK